MARFLLPFHKEKGYPETPVHDAVADRLTNPGDSDKETCFVDVELTGDYCRGETVVDRYGVWGQRSKC